MLDINKNEMDEVPKNSEKLLTDDEVRQEAKEEIKQKSKEEIIKEIKETSNKIEQLKEELKKELVELKEEIELETKEEVKQETKEEIELETKEEVKQETKKESKDKIKKDIKVKVRVKLKKIELLKEELKREIIEVKQETNEQKKQESIEKIKEKAKTIERLKEEVKKELIELKEETEQETKLEVKEEIKQETKLEVKEEIEQETKLEIKQENKEEIKKDDKDEIKQEVKQEPTLEIKENPKELINKAVPKKVVNRQYSSSELMKISYGLARNNLEPFLKCILGLALSLILALLVMLPFIKTMLGDNILGFTEVNELTAILDIFFNFIQFFIVGFVLIFVMIILFSFIYEYKKIWLIIATIGDITTGIERIDSKKAKSPKISSFIIMLGIQLLTSVLFLMLTFYVITALIRTGSLALGALIYISIILFFAKNYTYFCLFEVFAKGSNVSNALLNAGKNMFNSKNSILGKSFSGGLKIGFWVSIVVLFMSFFGSLVTLIGASSGATFLTILLELCLSVLFICISGYLGFVNIIYSYLVYMLNEV